MPSIKRNRFDIVFSDYIRYRDKWTCQRCNKKYPVKTRGLQCSHFYGRRSYATRFEPANAMALCYRCHIHVAEYPMEHVDLWESKFSKEETDRINYLHYQTNVKKNQIETEETYQKLRRMLNEEKGEGFTSIK